MHVGFAVFWRVEVNDAGDVVDVWVGGTHVVEDGTLNTIDVPSIIDEIEARQPHLSTLFGDQRP